MKGKQPNCPGWETEPPPHWCCPTWASSISRGECNIRGGEYAISISPPKKSHCIVTIPKASGGGGIIRVRDLPGGGVLYGAGYYSRVQLQKDSNICMFVYCSLYICSLVLLSSCSLSCAQTCLEFKHGKEPLPSGTGWSSRRRAIKMTLSKVNSFVNSICWCSHGHINPLYLFAPIFSCSFFSNPIHNLFTCAIIHFSFLELACSV